MKIKIALLLLCCFILSGCGYYRTITGTVIDAETLKPIEGAVVMAEWTTNVGSIGSSATASYKVVEVVTDANGKVTIEGLFSLVVHPPRLTIYKPGYVVWSSWGGFPVDIERDFRWESQTFKLERFKPGYSYVEHESFFSSAIHSTLGGKKLIRDTFDNWEKDKFIEEMNQRNEMRKRKERGEKQ